MKQESYPDVSAGRIYWPRGARHYYNAKRDSFLRGPAHKNRAEEKAGPLRSE